MRRELTLLKPWIPVEHNSVPIKFTILGKQLVRLFVLIEVIIIKCILDWVSTFTIISKFKEHISLNMKLSEV